MDPTSPLRLAAAALALASLPSSGAAQAAEEADDRTPPFGIRFGDPAELAYDAPFFPGAEHDPSVPAPEAVLGQALGTRLSRHDEILACFRAFAAASPRVTLAAHGRTHEGRELVHAVVTSPENHARLDAILADRARLDDPRGLSDAEAEALLERAVPVAWMAYSIHGDELSGSDAAIALGHHLAAGTGAEVRRLLDELVIVIDPCMNPDGRMRILGMVEQSAGYTPNLDYASMHRGRWPYGRGNHYLFDLNRDWMAGTQPESAGRWRAIGRFRPDLLVDAHEMGPLDTFLFYPQEPPLNPFLPERHAYWHHAFAAGTAAAFDARGWSYYTREWADGWAPFYSDAWASLTGAIGILYEQASTAGFPVRRASGDVLTYRESVHHQVAASMADLRTLRERGGEVLADHLANQRRNVGEATPDRAFVVPPSPNRARVAELLRVLLGQGVEVLRAEEAFTARDVEDLLGGRAEERELPAGTLIVPARQPRAQVVRAYLTFDVRLDEAALRAEREALEQTGESRIYDLTAWSLPHALAVDAAWCATPDVAAERVTAAPAAPDEAAEDDAAAVAWAVDAEDDRALAFAARGLEAGLAIHAADRGFDAAGRTFSRGSFLVRRHENDALEDVARAVRRAARDAGVRARAIGTSRAPEEGPDLGGGHFHLLARPRVAMLANAPVDPDTYGHLWHHLDRELGVPFTLLDAQAFGWADLRRYNALVLPPGAGPFVREHAEALARWVEGGGTLIAIDDAAGAATETELSGVTLRRDALEELERFRAAAARERAAFAVEIDPAAVWEGRPAEAGDAGAEDAAAEEPEPPTPAEDARARLFSPYGVTLRAELSPRRWITAGAAPWEAGPRPDALFELPVFFSGDRVFLSAEDGVVAARLAPAERLRLGGLLWPEARERIADSAWLTVEGRGDGQVILFASMPAFRGYHAATARLFGNAVVLGPGLGASQPLGW